MKSSIAIPESRRLDILAQLLEARGANVLRVPLVAIKDAPDPQPVLAWMHDFIQSPPNELILLTGEGVRRLLKLARAHNMEEEFIAALAKVCKLCRGPKPGRALAEIETKAALKSALKPAIQALAPTTDGVIASLEKMPIEGHRVAVQLYGQDPNRKLVAYLESRGAVVSTVAPYIYADEAEEQQVVSLIQAMAAGEVSVIAFTSQPQFRRLQQVAKKHELLDRLDEGMNKVILAAVGPLVRDQLTAAGYDVAIMPERTYFMKPLVTAIVKYLNQT